MSELGEYDMSHPRTDGQP